MRRRFHAPPEAFAGDDSRVVLSVEESRHLRDVLRLRAGDEAHVFDGEGREFACVVGETDTRGRESTLEIVGRVEPQRPESPLDLTLAVSLLKGEKLDLVVQKATELGVMRVVPVLTARADVRPRDERDTVRRVERWRRLALEAAKQSGRARVPTVVEPCALEPFIVGAARVGDLRVMFAERDGVGLDSLTNSIESTPVSITALVGPEGGWDDEEIRLASAHDWKIITLGGRTLRAETAAVIVSALLQNLFGDLR